MKKTIVLALMFLFFISFSSSALGQEIKVGTVLPHSGALKESGPNVQKGVVLAAKQMASAGFDIMLVHEDSQTSPGAAAEAATKLVQEDRVVAIVGAEASSVTGAMAEVVTCPNGIILISHASTSPMLMALPECQGKKILYRTCPSDALQGVILAKLAAGLYQTASVLYVNNAYGQGLAEQFKRSYEKRGGKVLAMVPHHEEVSTSYAAELKTALAASYVPARPLVTGRSKDYLKKTYLPQKPEVLCAFSYPEHAKVYLKEAIERFKYRSFLFCDGTKSVDILEAVGADNLEGMMGTSGGTAGGEPYLDFIADFKGAYGTLPPLPFITNAYDAMAVIGLAAYAAKAKNLPLTSENIKEQIRLVANPPGHFIKPGEYETAFSLLTQGKDINYEGASGSVDFDENGDVVTPIEVWQYAGGRIVTFRMEYQIPEE